MGLSSDIEFFAATDVGRKRAHNEDNFLVDRDIGLFMVCDGMGGHAAGEVASAMAVRTVHQELAQEREALRDRAEKGTRSEVSVKYILSLLDHAVQCASQKIHAEAQLDASRRGMGTTLSALLLLDAYAFVAHVGDSRIYLDRQGSLHQVTEDHTVGNELVRAGLVTATEVERVPRRNAITRAVGVYERAEVDTLSLEILPADQFLLASDGLTGYFGDPDAARALLAVPDGEAAVRGLIDFANGKGGKDNITAILVRLGRGDARDTLRARQLRLKREALAHMPLFQKLDDRELLNIMQLADVRQFEPGEAVVREGEQGDELFIVLTGRLNISHGSSVLGFVGPGDHFGEMALLRSGARSATVTAVEPSELITLKRESFFEVIRTDPRVAVKLLWQFVGVLANRLEATSRDLSQAREELDAESLSSEVPSGEEADPFAQPPSTSALRLGFRGDGDRAPAVHLGVLSARGAAITAQADAIGGRHDDEGVRHDAVTRRDGSRPQGDSTPPDADAEDAPLTPRLGTRGPPGAGPTPPMVPPTEPPAEPPGPLADSGAVTLRRPDPPPARFNETLRSRPDQQSPLLRPAAQILGAAPPLATKVSLGAPSAPKPPAPPPSPPAPPAPGQPPGPAGSPPTPAPVAHRTVPMGPGAAPGFRGIPVTEPVEPGGDLQQELDKLREEYRRRLEEAAAKKRR
ncbi:MAG: cyclic nucleotide-binding domain-containing protein [Polyangiaceae bacterium]|nr:cyclic nucleotide-binding domain-containing protein [Polyangiaceae bacterium]